MTGGLVEVWIDFSPRIKDDTITLQQFDAIKALVVARTTRKPTTEIETSLENYGIQRFGSLSGVQDFSKGDNATLGQGMLGPEDRVIMISASIETSEESNIFDLRFEHSTRPVDQPDKKEPTGREGSRGGIGCTGLRRVQERLDCRLSHHREAQEP